MTHHTTLLLSQVINDDSDTFVAFCPIWSVPCQRLSRPWSDLGNSLAREDDEVCDLYFELSVSTCIVSQNSSLLCNKGENSGSRL